MEAGAVDIDRFYRRSSERGPEWIPAGCSSSVPFDPYSVQNMMLATIASAPQSFSVSSPTMTANAGHINGSVAALASQAMDPATNPFFWFQVQAARQDQLIARAYRDDSTRPAQPGSAAGQGHPDDRVDQRQYQAG